MDNEFMPPHENGEGERAAPPANGDNAAPLDAAAVIEQVRELLFGDHRRSTEGALKGLEDAGGKTTMRDDLAASIRRTIAGRPTRGSCSS